MMAQTKININLKALEHNIKQVTNLVGKKKIQAVVKANAYGHGDVEMARALENIGVHCLGVARVEEGIRLRENGIKIPILVLGGAEKNEFESLIANKLIPVLYNSDNAITFNEYLKFMELNYPVHIKIDTGMHRIGIKSDNLVNFFAELKELKYIKVEGLMSHMVSAGSKELEWSSVQKNRFLESLDAWKSSFGKLPEYIHMENSAGFFNYNFDFTNMVRLGIAIYGYGMEGLNPVLSLSSYVKDIKDVKKGETISYGGWFRAQEAMKIAIVPVGYGDGFMRSARKGAVLINGKEAPIQGVICMDYFMVDISELGDIKLGDKVSIIAPERDAVYWAKTSGTIVYEILTQLNPRIRRMYNGSEN